MAWNQNRWYAKGDSAGHGDERRLKPNRDEERDRLVDAGWGNAAAPGVWSQQATEQAAFPPSSCWLYYGIPNWL